MDKIDIIHVYGKIAPLEWQEPNGLPFGNLKMRSTYDILERLKDNIRIIYDDERSFDEDQHVKNIQDTIRGANLIYFLGFGWDQQNMRILGLPGVLNKDQFIFATTYGFLNQEVNPIYKKLTGSMGTGSRLAVRFGQKDCDCLRCLREGASLTNRFA